VGHPVDENPGENPTRRAGPLRRGRIAAGATARQERFNVKKSIKKERKQYMLALIHALSLL